MVAAINGAKHASADGRRKQDLWRAGHAHAGIMLIISLLVLRYVDETNLRGGWLWLARTGVPIAAILMPAGFFGSILFPDQTEPNALIGLVPLGGLFLVAGLLVTGIGLVRADGRSRVTDGSTA